MSSVVLVPDSKDNSRTEVLAFVEVSLFACFGALNKYFPVASLYTLVTRLSSKLFQMFRSSVTIRPCKLQEVVSNEFNSLSFDQKWLMFEL